MPFSCWELFHYRSRCSRWRRRKLSCSVARGHSCATNCDRKHLDIRVRFNELLASNIRNNIEIRIYPHKVIIIKPIFLVMTRPIPMCRQPVSRRRKTRAVKFILKFMRHVCSSLRLHLRVGIRVLRPSHKHRWQKLRIRYHATHGILRISRSTINHPSLPAYKHRSRCELRNINFRKPGCGIWLNRPGKKGCLWSSIVIECFPSC